MTKVSKKRKFQKKKMRDVSYLKPKGCEDWLTLTELCNAVSRDPSWIRVLEQRGDIPQAKRIKRGQLKVRLYPPAYVEEIKEVLSKLRPGRPANV